MRTIRQACGMATSIANPKASTEKYSYRINTTNNPEQTKCAWGFIIQEIIYAVGLAENIA
jgi:hypothetical protein